MIRAVIFDLDGTLIHLPVNYEKLFEEFKKIMKTNTVRPVTDIVARLDETTKKKVFKVWDDAELEALPKMSINEEGAKLYEKFSPKPKALVTMQGKAVAEKILQTTKFSFKIIITREHSLNRIEQLQKAAEMLGVKPQEILFIGDAENDSASARKFGCKFLKVG